MSYRVLLHPHQCSLVWFHLLMRPVYLLVNQQLDGSILSCTSFKRTLYMTSQKGRTIVQLVMCVALKDLKLPLDGIQHQAWDLSTSSYSETL